MKKLADDWITKGLLDFEYKKYVLLAYLQFVEKSFDERKLYPPFADLISHYRNVEALKEGKSKLLQSFPKRLNHIDIKNFEMFFESMEKDDEHAQELEAIINYSLEQMNGRLNIGKNIFESVEKQLVIESIGVKALKDDEGLLLIDQDYDKFYHIYKYRVSIFETAHEKVRGLQTDFIESVKKSIGSSIEQLKVKIINNMKLVSNFSTFRIVSLQPVPYNETLLPIVKRKFSAYLAGK
ncbi:hypothetical protein JKA74_14470 [Marivirga sp. S37H4]|uniref:Uncharacterized protein n=1 Tax=Marivirga aurantiaca TaxID=2802615 RepID=A0A935CAK8_9BACT|nr:hypothetical protein [Marivirga aurantiaca]MBK6266247.1 hypothetical protein [Marivirga aurantiaca]